MRIGIFALALGFSGALAITAVSCGGTDSNNGDGSVKLDGGDGSAAADDMAKAPLGCWAALTGNKTTSGESKTRKDALLACVSAKCGTASDGKGLPCSVASDGGASDACAICLTNVQVNDEITFTDNSGKTLECLPDVSAPTCKGCATEVIACVLNCNSDKDCDGITNGGVAATCVANECQ